jgi:S-adenosylmethionine:tRNA ribosyltransferase-isomerase
MFTLQQFDYHFPQELIAQSPIEPRDACRLLVLDREAEQVSHHHFRDITELLDDNVVLVRNNTKVLPARLYGRKDTGGKCEVLLVRQLGNSTPEKTTRWECLTKPGLKTGQVVHFPYQDDQAPLLSGTCVGDSNILGYTKIVEFNCPTTQFYPLVFELGKTPLPPYITNAPDDEATLRELYQTTFAQSLGSVAAPTAGLHFTPELDQALRDKGIQILEVTLHVGLGTFLPVQAEQLSEKRLHQEIFELTPHTATAIHQAKQLGKKIIAVGTTTTRVLESCAKDGRLVAQSGFTQLFIQPGDTFEIIDGLITNFHVPQSSLLMLVSALTSAPNTSHPFTSFAQSPVGKAYQTAIAEKYRLFSFGDAMLIW